MQNENSKCKIFAEAGYPLTKLFQDSTNKNLTGVEWATGIPGTIGGAIWGNAGAFGNSIGEIVKTVEVFDIREEKVKVFQNKDCEFKYRDSIFRKIKTRAPSTQNLSARCSDLIILSVEFQLKKGDKKNIENKIKECLKVRKEKIPYGFSAGSIFKNIKKQTLNKKQLKTIPLKRIKGGKISVAYLIEESGLKGKVIGSAKISEKHANFIINIDKAKSKDVLKLINLVKRKVKKKFGIILEKEIYYLE